MENSDRVAEQLQDIPQYRELTEMLERGSEMRAALEDMSFASDVTKLAYSKGISLLDEKTRMLATSPELQDSIALLGAQSLSALCELDLVGTEKTDEEQQSKDESLRQTIQTIKDYFETYGVLTKEAGATVLAISKLGGFTLDRAIVAQAETKVKQQPKAKRKDTLAEVQVEVPEVLLEFNQRGLAIGRTKAVNCYPSSETIATTCKQIMALLIDSPSDRWSIPDALDELGIDIEDLGKNRKAAFTDIREWLMASTYRGQELIVRYGHSTNTEYGWTPELKPRVYDGNIIDEAEDTPSEAPDTRLTASEVLERSQQEKIKAKELKSLEDEIWIIEGLRASSLYLTARKLHRLSDVLEGYGLPTISDQLVDTLKAFLPADIKQLKDLNGYRNRAYEEVMAVFGNETRFLELIDHLNSDSDKVITELVEFLTDFLDKEDNKGLISRIMNSSFATRGTISTEGRSTNIDITKLVCDANGIQLWPIPGKPKSQSITLRPQKIPTMPDAVVPGNSSPTSASPEPEEAPSQPSEANLTPSQQRLLEEFKMYGHNRYDTRRREQLDKVEEKAEQLASVFVEVFGTNAEPKLGVIGNVFRSFQRDVMSHSGKSSLRRMHASGDQLTFSLRDFLRISLTQDRGLRNVIVSQANAKLVSNIIDRIATEAESSVKKSQSQQ